MASLCAAGHPYLKKSLVAPCSHMIGGVGGHMTTSSFYYHESWKEEVICGEL